MEQLRNLTMVEARKNNGDDDDEDLVIGSSSFSGISSGSSSSSSSMELSDSFEEVTSNPLSDMSSLLHQLPIKRGLSRHYDGKSRSFTSLASVRSLEDLAKKPEERRRNAAMCRRSMNALSRHICKREWHSSNNPRNYSSSLSDSKRINSSVNNFMATRPPIPPPRHTHRRSTTSTTTTTISTQTALFA